jgi:nicotinamide-nucleotide amidase
LSEIEALSKQLGEKLLEKGWSVTTAESCTGGGICAAITEIAGSSGYFERSFITYSNQAKNQMIKVPQELLDIHGAVSEPVANAMALGALQAANANLAIAVTGIAGPGGGTELKPVGTVFLAVAVKKENSETTVQVYKLNLTGSRKEIREQTIKSSLINALEVF